MRSHRRWIGAAVVAAAGLLAATGSLSAGEAAVPAGLERVDALCEEGRWEEAEVMARELLAEAEDARGSGSLEVAEVLDLLVEALTESGQVMGPEMLSLAERAVKIKERHLGPDHPGLAKSLMLHVRALSARADFAEAVPLCERALAIRRAALGPEHRDSIWSLLRLASIHDELKDKERALDLARRALALAERGLGPEDEMVGHCLRRLTLILGACGEGLAAAERATAVYEQALGPDHSLVSESLTNGALLLVHRGDYAAARRDLERAISIRERALGPDDIWGVPIPRLLSIVHRLTGNYPEALALQERYRRTVERVHGPRHRWMGNTLGQIGITYREMGDFAEARRLHEQALAIYEESLGPDHVAVARALTNLAMDLGRMGRHAEAIPLLERAWEIRLKTVGPEHPRGVIVLSPLAEMLWKAGDSERAMTLYRRCLDLRDRHYGPRHPDQARDLAHLAQLLWETDEREDAFEAAVEATLIGAEHVRLTGRALPERQMLAYSGVLDSNLDLALSMAALDRCRNRSATAARAWDGMVRWRALVLDEMAARHRIVLEAGDVESARLFNQLAAARRRLANLSVRGSGGMRPDTYRRLLEEARREKDRAEQALAARSAAFGEELSGSRVGLSDVQAALPRGSALVAFARYARHELAADPEHPAARELQPSYLAFVLRGGGAVPAVVPLGPASVIDPLVSEWTEEAALGLEGAGRTVPEAEAAHDRAGAALRRKVWDPLLPYMEGARMVFLVPDGALQLVSFAALPLDEGSFLLEEGPLLHYLSAERDLVAGRSEGLGAGGLLALGNPSFDEPSLFAALQGGRKPSPSVPALVASLAAFRGQRSACGDFQSMHFQPVPASRREVRAVGALWRKGTGGAPATLLTGPEASEAAFKAEAPGKGVLHLATHGFFLNGICPSAGRGGAAGHAGENPLLLSGLALAGANHRRAAGPEEEDGILTAEEVAALDLSAARLAVLSACDTGVGEVRAGEGVLGLRRAFRMAGVETLVTSLWPVEDEAARLWMKAFYRARFVRGMRVPESVREASLEVMRQQHRREGTRHPSSWAAFVASGDWR